jgi:hypothetical protein
MLLKILWSIFYIATLSKIRVIFMADINSFHSKKAPVVNLPKNLNILTILTIVGSSIMAVSALVTPFVLSISTTIMDKLNTDTAKKFTNKQLQDFEQARQLMALQKEHMIPLMLISLVGCALCFTGAIMMRKLKKEGFWYYVSGQIIPFIGASFILCYAQFSSIWNFLVVMISFLFISLYNKQRHFLVN